MYIKKGKNFKKGAGWTDLPFEMHLPSNFCGLGTKLNKRLDSK